MTISDTYSKMTNIYDEIFPFSENTFNFLSFFTKGKSSILDIGSATGKYVTEFVEQGFSAAGLEYVSDFSFTKYPMIQGDMNFLPLKKETFDLIYCIGNTISHLKGRGGLLNFMKQIWDTLSPKGKFIVQIINYDRIFNKRIEKLPDINTEDYLFTRDYEYKDSSSLDFIGKIYQKSNSTLYHSFSQKLTPYMYNDFIWITNKLEFLFTQFYGDFNGGKFYKNESFVCIAVFTKP